MKIDATLAPSTAVSTVAQKTAVPQPAGPLPSPAVVESDSVTISEAASDSDAARRKRVEAIRAQLAAGNYNISGKDVADKMLNVLKG